MDFMQPAVILLFVYNRPEHTKKTLAALSRNNLVSQSDLVIFSDGPKSDSEVANVAAVRQILSGISGFKSTKIILRDVNYGLAKSVISGVTEVLREYPEVIVMEDDLETTPNFLEFMNNALNYYRDDHKAFSIGGYQFPSSTMVIPKSYPYDTYSSYRCCSWGWATWSNRWNLIDWNTPTYSEFMKDAYLQDRFNRGGSDLTQLLEMQLQGKIDSWAIRFCFAQFLNEAYCITPIKTFVRNIGLDNSGVHCGIDPKREHATLDYNWHAENFSPASLLNEQILFDHKRAFEAAPVSDKIYNKIKRLIANSLSGLRF